METEAKIKRYLEKECGGVFLNTVWGKIYRDVIRQHLEDPEFTPWSEVLEYAKEQLTYQEDIERESAERIGIAPFSEERTDQSGPSGVDTGERFDTVERSIGTRLTAEEALRAEVFEEYLAKAMDADYFVSRFRRRNLRGRLLPPDAVHRFIRSTASQTLTGGWFTAMDIPPSNHDADLLAYEYAQDTGPSASDRATLRVRWPENAQGIVETVYSPAHKDRRFRSLHFVNEEGRAESIRVWSNSVLGDLQELVARLVKRAPWQEAQATRYVLTGEPPAVPPVRMQYQWEPAKVLIDVDEPQCFNRATIVLHVAPWISESTVRKIHRDLQGRALGRRDNRRVEEKALKLLRFVIERENPTSLTRGKRRRVGKHLVQAWDKASPPHWAFGRYQQPTSEFWKTYNRAEALVMEPSYVSPEALRQNGGLP